MKGFRNEKRTSMIGENAGADSAKTIAFVRYLGVDVRPRSYGFVVIEGGTLLDSGIRICDRSQFDDCLGQRFLRILQTYSPSVVIMRKLTSPPAADRKRAIVAAIKKAARQCKVDVAFISPAALRRHFSRYNASTKYEIARAVAQIFPDLAWKLPHKRKSWESEHHRMSIFDAAAVVISYTMK